MAASTAATVAYAWATAVGGLVPDAELAFYAPRAAMGCNVAAEIGASPAVAGLCTYSASNLMVSGSGSGIPGPDDARVLTVVPATGPSAPYDAPALGNAEAGLRATVAADGASVGAASVEAVPTFASTWSLAGPAFWASADLRTGVVTASNATSTWGSNVVATTVALRQYPNVVLQSLTFDGNTPSATTVTHALVAPPGAFAAAFSASTLRTPGSNVLLRSVDGAARVGWLGSPEVGRARARAAYVVPPGTAQPVERLLPGGGSYETAFEVAPPATVSVLVAHGLEPAAAARVLGAAADDLASGRLLAAHAAAEAVRTRPRVGVAIKAGALGDPALEADVAFHQRALDGAVQALMDAAPADVGLDADLWVVPPLLLLRPEAARPFVDARLTELPAAQANARERGLRGALFLPASSAASAASAASATTSESALPLYRTGLASLAAWNFFRASHDRQWLADGGGYALLQNAADLFVSVLPSPDSSAVPRVLGVDGLPSDDDAFTNVLAFLAVKNALEASYDLGFAGKAAWIAVFDAADAFGRHPLVAAVSAASAPLAAWPLGFAVPPAPGDEMGGPPVAFDAAPATTAEALASIARAAFLILRAQGQAAPDVQAAADVAEAHAALTAAARATEGRPWGLVRDVRVAGAYLLAYLSTYGQLAVSGGINRQRYAYAPFAVPEPQGTGGVMPRHVGSLAFYTGVEAGDFLMTNSLPFSA